MDSSHGAQQFEKPFPFCRRDVDLKWNGWGWNDSQFVINENNNAEFTGNRYDICGKQFKQLRMYMEAKINADINRPSFPKNRLTEAQIPPAVINENFLNWLKSKQIVFSTDGLKRINRSHGHTVEEMVTLRIGECEKRIPDLVVFPENHKDVVDIVAAANRMDVVIIPIGGGTSVSNALCCPANEKRCIVSLDVCRMNRILWIDEKNLVARAECGIIGIDLEQQLNEKGFTIGHEPDSVEFSTLGGWVATRASGIRKNKYGNIEDLLVHVTFVTPNGVIEKSCLAPRISSGPDLHHFIMGSEGILGVVTEVTFKICELPKCKKFGSVLFPTFEHGVNMMREVAKQKCAPTSIRLMDNEQFQFGQALKPNATTFTALSDYVKKLYLTKWKRFDPKQMCPATLLFEGTEEEVKLQEQRIYKIAQNFGGIAAGAENGRYGYMLTYSIAYLRDLVMNYYGLAESFETSVSWDKVYLLCNNVKEVCLREALRLGVNYPAYVSCRVTQVYDVGACIYFYFGFTYRDLEITSGDDVDKAKHGLEIFEKIETAARNEILACGGSISHHHGVGKLRKRWMPETVGEVGLSALQAVKRQLDPNNIFASGNLFTVSKL